MKRSKEPPLEAIKLVGDIKTWQLLTKQERRQILTDIQEQTQKPTVVQDKRS